MNCRGHYAAARPHFERALAIREKALGPEHPDTALSLNNLAVLLYSQGDTATARPYYARALAIREKALGPDHPDVRAGLPLRGMNQWTEDMPELRADMTAYFRALNAMCDRMLPPFAVALGMSEDFFAPFFANECHANLRFLHYPPQEDMSDNTFGTAPHTDNSFMTALARTDVPGLAIRLPSGEWLPPPIIPGTFLINLGNMMRRWSNDRLRSTRHRALNRSGGDRYAIPFFYDPRVDTVIECLPTCTDADHPPRYAPILAGEHMLAKLERREARAAV